MTKIPLLYEQESYLLRGLWIDIHKMLGPGHTEVTYGNAFEKILKEKNIPYVREPHFPLSYNGQKVGNYRPDFVVFGKIIVEFKSLQFIPDVFIKKLERYLAVSDYKLGFIVNFGASKTQIIRRIHDQLKQPQRVQRFSAVSALIQKGFTMVELVLVVGILVVLSAIVLVALKVPQYRGQAHNVQRKTDVRSMHNAFLLYARDKDDYTAGLPTTPTCIGTGSDEFNLSSISWTKSPSDADIKFNVRACPDLACTGDPLWSQDYGISGAALNISDASFFQYRATFNNIQSLAWTQTTDADFNAGTNANTAVSSNSIILSRPDPTTSPSKVGYCNSGSSDARCSLTTGSTYNINGQTINATSFFIESGVTVNVNQSTSALIINANGNVDIDGTLQANGGTGGTYAKGAKGAGGSDGGDGARYAAISASNGSGNGFGYAGINYYADDYGTGGGGGGFGGAGGTVSGGGSGGAINGVMGDTNGGSGGGGGGSDCSQNSAYKGGGGGGGGGRVSIITNKLISIGSGGLIITNGGNGGPGSGGASAGGGGGSGGSIRLEAYNIINNNINASGSIRANGGNGVGGGGGGGGGRILLVDNDGAIGGAGTVSRVKGSGGTGATDNTEAYTQAIPSYVSSGTYISDVKDLESQAFFSAISWTTIGSVPGDGEITLGDANLKGLWHFNENAGANTKDVLGVNNGTMTGTSYWTASGKFSAEFNGSGDDYITINDNNALDIGAGDWSTEAWFKLSSSGAGTMRTILSKDDLYDLKINSSNQVMAGIYDPNDTDEKIITGDTVINDTTDWHHAVLVFTKSAGKVDLYVDGKLDGTGSISPVALAGDFSNGANLRIGANGFGANIFYGNIDEVSVWSRVLTGPSVNCSANDPYSALYDVCRHYNGGFGAPHIKFQARSCASSCTTEAFVGPDGTANTYYKSAGTYGSGSNLNLSSNQWVQYKAYLYSSDLSQTPVIDSVRVDFSTSSINLPKLEEVAVGAIFASNGAGINLIFSSFGDFTGGGTNSGQIIPDGSLSILDEGAVRYQGGTDSKYVSPVISAECYDIKQIPGFIPDYLPEVPKDPKIGTDENTGYFFSANPEMGTVTISAPAAELGETIRN